MNESGSMPVNRQRSCGVLFVAEQQDVIAIGSADEASDPAVDRFDPGGAPRVDGGIVEADRGTVEGQRRLALTGLSACRDDPDVLGRAPAEDRAEVQLAGCRRRLAAAGPLQVPGADETAEEHECVGVLARRTADVQSLDEPAGRSGR